MYVLCHLLVFKLSKMAGWWQFWRSGPVCSERCTLTGAPHHSERCSFQYLSAKLEWKGCKFKRGMPAPTEEFPTRFGAALSLVYLIFFSIMFPLVGLNLRNVIVKHFPEIPCFYTTVNIWIPERWSEKLKASRQLYLTSVILQNCSSLDRSAVLNCSTLPAGLWRNSLKVKSLTSLTCLFDAEHQLVQLVLHGFRCPSERYSPAHPSSRICCSARCRRPL